MNLDDGLRARSLPDALREERSEDATPPPGVPRGENRLLLASFIVILLALGAAAAWGLAQLAGLIAR